MKKSILLLVVLVFYVSVNAQNVLQEFDFNGSLSNTFNTISFSGDAQYVKDRTGANNSALRITNNVIEATIPNLPLANSRRTISIWIKYNDVTVANYIWGYGSLVNTQYFGLWQQSATASKSDLNLAGWGSANDVMVNTTIETGIWYNYTVTYDGLTSKIYRNGELIKSSISPRKLTSAVVFSIGKMGSAVSMDADIDDLRIYGTVLSAQEVAAIYNNDDGLIVNSDVAPTVSKKEIPKTDSLKSIAKTSASNSNIVLTAPIETIDLKISEVYSSEGLKVLSGDNSKIDITSLPEGTYLLKVVNSQNAATNKLTAN